MAKLLTVTKSGTGAGTVTGVSVGCDPQTGTATVPSSPTRTVTLLQSESISANFVNPNGVFFKPDGLQMYVIGENGGDNVIEYSLSVAWDITTIAVVTVKSVAAQMGRPHGVFFKPDGTKMLLAGGDSSSPFHDEVFEYDLSSAWDLSTASFSQSFQINSGNVGLTDVFFKPDGLEMYVTLSPAKDVLQYTLSSAWNVSTASFTGSFTNAGSVTGMSIEPDGLIMKLVTDVVADDAVREYSLSPAWDITTVALIGTFKVVNPPVGGPTGIFFRADKAKMYVSDRTLDRIYEYDIAGITVDNVTVTGTGTAFLTEFVVGEFLCLGNENREITAINSDTELVIASPYVATFTDEAVGKVASQPEIDCGATCALSFFDDTVVTLTATPDSESSFVQWTGDITGTTSPANVTMSQARTVDAEFKTLAIGPGPAIPASAGLGACAAVPASGGLVACP